MRVIEGETEMETACRNFVYVLCKSLGLIWLVKWLAFLDLKPHYKLRDEHPELLEDDDA